MRTHHKLSKEERHAQKEAEEKRDREIAEDRAEKKRIWDASSERQREDARCRYFERCVDMRAPHEHWKEAKAEYVKKVCESPGYAMKWGGASIFKKEYEVELFDKAYSIVFNESPRHTAVLSERLDTARHFIHDLLVGHLDGINSSCPVSRAQAVWKQEVQRSFLETIGHWEYAMKDVIESGWVGEIK